MTAATDDDWYIPYNGPIEPPPSSRIRTRPRGNTFGGPGADSAPKAAPGQGTNDYYEDHDLEEEEDHTFGYPYSNPQIKSSGPALAINTGRPRAGSYASSISVASYYTNTQTQSHTHTTYNSTTRTYFGGATSAGGIGQAPEHSSHREKDRDHREKEQPRSPASLGPRFSIYSNMIRGSDREKDRSGDGAGDKASIISSDWDTKYDDREPSHQRTSVVSFLTFGKRGTGTGRASPISPQQTQQTRGRTSSPVSLLSGIPVGRQSHESARSRVVMLPIGEKTGAGATKKGFIPLTPITASSAQMSGTSGTTTFVLTPTTTTTAGTGPNSTTSTTQSFIFPSYTPTQTKPLPFQVQRTKSLRGRSNTVDSMNAGMGYVTGIRGNDKEFEGRQRGRTIDGTERSQVGESQRDGRTEAREYQGEDDSDGLMDVKMDREWYEEAGYGPEDGRKQEGVGATQDRAREYDTQQRTLDYDKTPNHPRRLSHSASHPVLNSSSFATNNAPTSTTSSKVIGPSLTTIASVRATHPYALVFPTATSYGSAASINYQPSHQPNQQRQPLPQPHYSNHAHIESQSTIRTTDFSPRQHMGHAMQDRDGTYAYDTPSVSGHGHERGHAYAQGYAYDYDSSPHSQSQTQSYQRHTPLGSAGVDAGRDSAMGGSISLHPYAQALPPKKVSETSVSPAVLAARGGKSSSLRATKGSNSIRYSLSTPNLRNFFRIGSDKDKEKAKLEKEKNASSPKPKTQYAAETWCDALMFPRPRFRAHVISPPTTPVPEDEVLIERAADLQRSLSLSPHANEASGADHMQTFQTRQSHFSLDTPNNSTRGPKLNLMPPPPGKAKSLRRGRSAKAADVDVPQLPPIIPESPITLTEAALLAGAQRDRERQEWSEMAKGSFQNRRSRSLSRPRKKSLGGGTMKSTRVRVDSDASGMSRPGGGITKALTSLAAEVFRQPTPTISVRESGHVQSSGYGTESMNSHSYHGHHSRNTSESHGRGHARNTSWGKTALKKLCGPEEDVVNAELEEAAARKRANLEDVLRSERTIKMGVNGRREEQPQREKDTEVRFIDLTPRIGGHSSPQKPWQDQGYLRPTEPPSTSVGRTSPQSQGSDALEVPVVGIALSTPPPPSPPPSLPDMSMHPYAQQSGPRRDNGYPEPVPLSAPYAGPHPTSRDYKPRFPIHRSKSPEASHNTQALQSLNAAIQAGATLPSLGTLPIIKPPPAEASDTSNGSHRPNNNRYDSPSAFAYADVAVNEKRESTLGVEEVLMSTAFQRGQSPVPEVSEMDAESNREEEFEDDEPQDHTARPGIVEPLQVTDDPHLGLESSRPVSHDLRLPLPPEDIVRQDPDSSPDVELDGSQEIVRPTRGASTSTVISSPSSIDSSFPGNPRPLGKIDDREFSDLFFKPGKTPSHSDTFSFQERPSGPSRDTSNSWIEERIMSRSSDLSGFGYLARQLSEELQQEGVLSSLSPKSSRTDNMRSHSGELEDVVEDDAPENDYRHNPVQERTPASSLMGERSHTQSTLPGLTEETLQIGTPMRAEFTQGQDFPEDVDTDADIPESSRASSIIEHEPVHDDTLRIGSVALSIPVTTENEHRQSTALSIDGVEAEETSPQRYRLSNRDTFLTTSSNYPGGEFRTSYMTTTSSTSHMENLINDFPSVPAFPDAIPASRPDSIHVLGLASSPPRTNSN